MLNVRFEGMLMAFQSHVQPCKRLAYLLGFSHFRIDTFSKQKGPQSSTHIYEALTRIVHGDQTTVVLYDVSKAKA